MKRKAIHKALKKLTARLPRTPKKDPPTFQQALTPEITEQDLKALPLLSFNYYQSVLKVWNLVFLSLPLDLVVLFLLLDMRVPEQSTELVQSFFYLFLAFSLLALFREQIISWLLQIQGLKETLRKKSENYMQYIGLLIPAVILIDILIKIQHLGLIPILIILFFFFIKIPKWLKEFQTKQEKWQSEAGAKYHKALILTEQLRSVFFAQIAIIRGMSLLGAVTVACRQDIENPAAHLFVILLTATVLLSISKPDISDFISNCARCASKTSRAFRNTYYCPECLSKNYKGTVRE